MMIWSRLLSVALVGFVCVASRGQQLVTRMTILPGMFVNINVGLPAQQFTVLFNTGSANTWLVGANCTAIFCTKQENKYNSSMSSTHVPDGRLWQTNYGFGAVFEGELSRESVSLTRGGITIDNQLFGQVNKTYGWLADHLKLDGVLGVGSRYAAVIDLKDPIENLFDQTLITQKLFSLHLTKNETKDELTGEVVLGGIDDNYFTGQLNYVPIVDRWTFYLDYVTVPSSLLRYSVFDKALLDSSSNIIQAPRDVVLKIRELFQTPLDRQTGLSLFRSCNDIPDEQINLVIGGVNMSLSAKDLVIKLQESRRSVCYLALKINMEDGWVLGTPFLRKYYTVFDYSNKQLGFALSV